MVICFTRTKAKLYHSVVIIMSNDEESAIYFNKLKRDSAIHYTNPDFLTLLQQHLKIDDWSDLQKLSLDPYPSPSLLAFLANASYTIGRKEEPDADVERKLRLPENWKLLTRCYNTRNHYEGAAFWNPSTLQVVIAHAGTSLRKLGTIKADLKSVVQNQYDSYVDSAVTFADRICTDVAGLSLQLSITGHSLGGWLAQVTAFTTEYLKCQGDGFVKASNVRYHPHAVAFDSPGCEAFLLKLQKDYNLRCVRANTHYTNLDITIYLSAPNLINTWDFHVGTVYRVFLITKKGFFQIMARPISHTKEYHSMESILGCFIGKTNKKMREVEDWPNRQRLFGCDEEYKQFLRDANYWNDFHLEVDYDKSIRYKTEEYDFSKTDIRIFSISERIFLETLCRFKEEKIKFTGQEELIKLFSVKDDEELFPDFKLNKDIISCDSDDMLKQLIKRLKNLFRWFPDKITVSKETKIVYPLCEMESNRYFTQLKKKNLSCKNILTAFFSSTDCRTVVIFSTDTLHDSAVFSTMCDAKKTIFLKYEQAVGLANHLFLIEIFESRYDTVFLEYNQMADDDLFLKKLLKSCVRKILLLVPYTDNKENLGEFLENLTTKTQILFHSSLKQNFQNLLNNYTYQEFDYFNYTSLTSDCWKKIVEETVKNCLPIRLETCYIKRKFIYNHIMEKKIWRLFSSVKNSSKFVFTGIKEKQDLVKILEVPKQKEDQILICSNITICSEIEARKRLYGKVKVPVHWLNVDNNQLLWSDSNNSAEILHEYVDFKSERRICEDSISKLMNFSSKIVVIADEAGMGKTTTLLSLANKIQAQWTGTYWIIFLTLNKIQYLCSQLPEKMRLENVAEFLLNASTTRQDADSSASKIILSLLQSCLQKASPKELIIMLDGFDEIKDESVCDKVLDFVDFLKQNTETRVFLTTRNHFKSKLERRLSVFALTFEKIDENEQKSFIKEFFKLTFEKRKYSNVDSAKIQVYIDKIYEMAQKNFNKEIIDLLGVPLHMRMLAEVVLPEEKFFKTYEKDPDSMLGLENINVYNLYEGFVESKLNIYYKKPDFELTSVAKKWVSEKVESLHQILAVQQVFPEDWEKFLQEEYVISEDDKMELSRVGLVQCNSGFELQFVHYTFAEYYMAKLLLKWLRKEQTERNTKFPDFEKFLLTKVLLESNYKTLRFFLNNCLKPYPKIALNFSDAIAELLQKDRFKLYANNGSSAFHITAIEGNEIIAKLLFNCEIANDEVIDFLTKTDTKARTALYFALDNENELWLKTFFDVWENCAYSIQQKFLLTTLAAFYDDKLKSRVRSYTTTINKLQTVFESLCEKLDAVKELYNILHQKKDVQRVLEQFDGPTRDMLLNTQFGKCLETPLHVVSKTGNEELLNYFLLSENCDPSCGDLEGNFPIHIAASHGHLNIVKSFHKHGIDLNVQNNYYVSVVAFAAKGRHLHVIKYLVENGANFERTDRNSINPLMRAAKAGGLEIVKYLIAKGEDVNKKDKFGLTALSYAAREGHLNIVEHLVREEEADVNCTDRFSKTPLVLAIKNTKWEVVNYLLTLEEVDINVVSFDHMTALDYAERVGKVDVISKLIKKGAKRYQELETE